MKIGGREIGIHKPPYIIAELSGSHLGDINNVYRLIDEAKAAGADAVKVQCYNADSMTIDCDKDEFLIKTGPWSGRTLYDLYKEACTPPEWMENIFSYARTKGIEIFASVFDEAGVDLMEELDAAAIKIASFEITDIPLLQRVAEAGKPTIVSTGMASTKEITRAISVLNRIAANHNVALLHCVSAYPAPANQANLPALGPLSELMGARHVVGLSDHTLGVGVAAAAVSFGACIIEKHLCLGRSAGGPDSGFSLEPLEFIQLVKACHEAWDATRPSVSRSQNENLLFRRSVYVTAPVAAGSVLSKENIRVIRPAHGLPASAYASVLGRRVKLDLEAGTPLSRDHLLGSDE